MPLEVFLQDFFYLPRLTRSSQFKLQLLCLLNKWQTGGVIEKVI
jgi:hypothetical protein